MKLTIRELNNITDGNVANGDFERYADRIITNMVTDSRSVKEDSAYLPIIGERVDGHSFISAALSNCYLSFSEKDDIDYAGDRIIIRVDSVQKAMNKIAEYYRSTIQIPIVAVTGSVGKTTTREMIAAALSSEGKVFSTKGNKNSQIGVPLTLSEFEDDAYIAVLELGMSMPDEMEKIADLVKPNCAVFTNIGVTHIENLGSREKIFEEKNHITDYLKDGEYVVINDDNDILHNAKWREGIKVLRYGLSENCDAYVKDINNDSGTPEFTAVVGDEEVRISLNVYGKHMIYNSLAALLVCKAYGVDLYKAAEKLSQFEGFAHRQQIIRTKHFVIIDDSYNANPDSMRAAIDMLDAFPARGKKIAVLGDMKELGEISAQEHKKIAQHIKSKSGIDKVFTIGEYSQLIDSDRHFSVKEELEEYIKDSIDDGDVILFKASNSFALFTCAELLSKME